MAKSIIGTYRYEDDFLEAIRKLRAAGVERLTAMSPIPMHAAWDVLELGVSPVRAFSLTGAIIGAIAGFTLATACALVFILPTGGRAIIAVPPFLVITYELTILTGVLVTLLAFHFVSGLPAWRDAPYRDEIIVDRFGVVVGYDEDSERETAERLMRETGADEIEAVDMET